METGENTIGNVTTKTIKTVNQIGCAPDTTDIIEIPDNQQQEKLYEQNAQKYVAVKMKNEDIKSEPKVSKNKRRRKKGGSFTSCLG